MSVSKKCSQHSYHHVRFSLKLSQNSKIFLRALFPGKATPEQSQNDWDTTLCCSSQSLMSFEKTSSSSVWHNLCSITFHQLVPSHWERYPWTPSCRSSFFPDKLSKFESIASLEGIVFAQCFWQRLVPTRHSRDWRNDLKHSVNLSCCWF